MHFAGPLLALTVVLAPDHPAVQCLGCQIILMTFMAVQIYNWPWKAPILNVVDMVICFLLAILVVVAGFYVPAASGGLLNFFEIFSMVVFALLFGVVAYLQMPQWSSGLVDTCCYCNTAFEHVGVSEPLAIRQTSIHSHHAFHQ